MTRVKPIDKAPKAHSTNKTSKKVSKGVGDTPDSMKAHSSNILYDIAHAFRSNEKISHESIKVKVQEIRQQTNKALETDKQISEVVEQLEQAKRTIPLLNSAKKIAEVLSISLSAVIGLELLSVGAPFTAAIFLTPSILAGVKQVGFFEEHKSLIDGLNIASGIGAVIAGRYSNAFDIIGKHTVESAIFFLSNVVQISSNYSSYKQKTIKSKFLDLQVAEQRIQNTITAFLNNIEQSFREDEKTRRSVEHLLLTNLNLAS